MSATSPANFLSHGTPESQLLFACARTALDLKASEKIRVLLQHRLDWEYVLRKAREHFIMPLVCRSLNNFPEAVPETILQRLQGEFSAHARRNLFFTGELLKILALLKESGVKAVSYKGPVLSQSAYGNVALRSFIDLDILVHERDVLRAKELLLSNGFQPRTKLTKAQDQARLRNRGQKDFVLFRPDLPISVELHWEIASFFLFPFDSRRLWERLETITFGGETVSNLRAEDMLLILCVHGAKHSFRRLEWICDIAELIRANPEMDWNEVNERAGRLGSKRMLYLGLFLASNLLAANVPRDVAQSIDADPKVKLLSSRVMTSLFNDNTGVAHGFTDITFTVNLREEWRARTRLRLQSYLYNFLKAVTPNVEDKEFVRLPAFLGFLSFFLRPIRLVYVYGRALVTQQIVAWKRRWTRRIC